MKKRFLWLSWALVSLRSGYAAEGELSFNRDIRPLLSKHCFSCHGPDEEGREGELRLDLEESALAGGESGDPAVVPGKPEESLLVKRIRHKNPRRLMPPPKAHLELAEADMEKLEEWIRQGAKYEGHWAFERPLKRDLPLGDEVSPIDRWVGDRLRREGLGFSKEEERGALLRRASLDLTGLPPTAEELEAFLKDQEPGAYERQVDRLLASPRFGEHFAVAWMDAARYADTNGYSIDGGRHQWLWRDWVIRAFNDNLPYDRFLVEQIAGDLLPGATEAQVVATGFQRNNANTHEGGTIPEENLVNYVADRVKTNSEVFLGLTMACAQCHDHKYDPVSQKEYYQFFAFFNTADDIGLDGDAGVNSRPAMNAKSVLASEGERVAVEKELAEAKAKWEAVDEAVVRGWVERERAADVEAGKGMKLWPLKVEEVSSPNGSPDRMKIQADGSVTLAHGDYAAYNARVVLPAEAGQVSGLRVEFLPSAATQGKLGFGGGGVEGNLVMSTITTSTSSFPAGNVDLNGSLVMKRITASASEPGYEPERVRDTTPTNGWSPPKGAQQAHWLTVTFETPVDVAVTPHLTTELMFNFGAGASPGHFRLYALTGNDDGSPHPAEVREWMVKGWEACGPEERKELGAYFRQHGPETKPLRDQIANLEERLAVLTQAHSVMVMNVSANPRKTHLLDRGLYSAPKEEVKAAVPAFLPPMEGVEGREANRLDLAKWMVRPDHPLTARVAVNRWWESLFGRGLAPSSADFGSQSTWPTHPELLDWLAVDLVESGWDFKRMVRMMVTSKTYRQSGAAGAELLAKDPRNELLARGPRFRLSAEQIRDQALWVSGLLVERMGGPSVKPYQPGDLWRQISHYGSSPATSQTFVQDHGEKLYRRSLYTYWKRTLPPVNLASFDAPNREVCAIGRTATNTPLQALVTLNDVQFVEAARVWAERLLKEGGDDRAKIVRGFRQVAAREPSAAEIEILMAALERERGRYAADADAAKRWLSIGESARDERLPLAEHAAWGQMASMLLNLSETLTRP